MKARKILYVLPYEFYFNGLNNTVGGHTSHIIGVIEAFRQKGFRIEIISDMPVPGLNAQAVTYSVPAFQSIRRMFRTLRISKNNRNPDAATGSFGYGKYWLRISALFLLNHINRLIFYLGLFTATLRCSIRSSTYLIYYRHNLNGFIPALVSKMTGIPSVVEVNTPISLSAHYYSKKICTDKLKPRVTWREMLQYEFSEVISVVSPIIQKWISENCRNCVSKKILVNPNGVNPDSFRPKNRAGYVRKRSNIAGNEILIGMAAVFVNYNAIEELVEAFRLAKGKFPRLRLLLMGESELRNSLEAHVSSQNLNESITFTGSVPFVRMGEYYSDCDILVSHFNFGNRPAHNCSIKHLEYMAAGKPVVATDIGHVNYAIKHNQNGLLVPHGDIQGFSEAILKLATDSELRFKFGNQARRDVESFHTWQDNINRILHRVSREPID